MLRWLKSLFKGFDMAELDRYNRVNRLIEREARCRELALRSWRSPRVSQYWTHEAERARLAYWGIVYADNN